MSVVRSREDAAEPTVGGQAARLDLRAFVSAVAGLLHETASRFEDTVSRVTEIAMAHRGRSERELIVTLQDFDRLQQEFVALGDVLARYASASDDDLSIRDGRAEFGHVLASIAVGDLKERLMRRLQGKTLDIVVPLQPGEELF
jgi:hypothetical protein